MLLFDLLLMLCVSSPGPAGPLSHSCFQAIRLCPTPMISIRSAARADVCLLHSAGLANDVCLLKRRVHLKPIRNRGISFPNKAHAMPLVMLVIVYILIKNEVL